MSRLTDARPYNSDDGHITQSAERLDHQTPSRAAVSVRIVLTKVGHERHVCHRRRVLGRYGATEKFGARSTFACTGVQAKAPTEC